MSFLNELKKQKEKLKGTETTVTNVDGQRFIESKRDSGILYKLPNTYGFVVDNKPDDTPILIGNYLYIGSQDCTMDNILHKYDIKNVLSLGIDIDISDMNHKYIHCLDLPETDIKPVLRECLPFIREAVIKRENILVHCNAGVSRTSMVTIAYLMHYELMCFETAYSLVKEKRPAVRPNDGFKKQLKAMIPGHII